MANPELVELLKQGSVAWNRWREQQPEDSLIDLSQANLNSTHLQRADLRRINLSSTLLVGIALPGANLAEADLSRANLSQANLSGVNLNSANLAHTNLSSSNLSRSSLNNADLRYATLYGANLNRAEIYNTDLSYSDLREAELHYTTFGNVPLDEANLSKAKIRGTTFARMDLRGAKGLAEIRHEGPSHIELYSVQLPQEDTAFHFLRGCGVPNEWTNSYLSAMVPPIRYHSCFISYSSKDEMLAHRLHTDLQVHGVRCWFTPEDMKIGAKIRSRIDEAIHLQDKLLLLLSEHALASDWVEVEVEAALEKERRQQQEVLFPIRLDNAVMQTTQAWAVTLRRTCHIGDFTNWTDPQAYQRAFERLLSDLKTDV